MHFLDLPCEVIGRVLGHLPARSLIKASCACKALKRIADGVGLRVTVTSQTWGIGRWLRSPNIARRVLYLHAKNSMWSRSYAFLGGMYNLRVLVMSFCRVQSSIFRFLPDTLRHLEVHMLCGNDPNSMFTTSKLSHLKNLEVLKITCDASLPVVIVSDIPPRVTLLQIRRAPAMIVSGMLRVPYVSLHAVSVLVCEHGILATSLVVMCDYGPVNVDAMLPPATREVVEDLTMVCPHVIEVPLLGLLTRVRRIKLRLDSLTLDTLPPNLDELDIETAYGFGTRHPLPSTITSVSIQVDDVPLSQRDIARLRHM
jgi:hypothetical protein